MRDRLAYSLGSVASKGGAVLRTRFLAVLQHARKVQHREARGALHQRADRRAAQAKDEVPFPMAWHRPIDGLGRTLADHDLGRHEALTPPARARPWNTQSPATSQAGGQLAT